MTGASSWSCGGQLAGWRCARDDGSLLRRAHGLEQDSFRRAAAGRGQRGHGARSREEHSTRGSPWCAACGPAGRGWKPDDWISRRVAALVVGAGLGRSARPSHRGHVSQSAVLYRRGSGRSDRHVSEPCRGTTQLERSSERRQERAGWASERAVMPLGEAVRWRRQQQRRRYLDQPDGREARVDRAGWRSTHKHGRRACRALRRGFASR